MRALATNELTNDILAPRVYHDVIVEVQDGDDFWREWSSYFVSASWGEHVDQAVAGATMRFRRSGGGTNSLAPLMSGSALNVYSGGYAPAIDKGRRIRLLTLCVAGDGTQPSGSTRGKVFTHSGMSAFTAANVSDGDITTNAWHTDTAVAGAYIQVDYGANVNFRGIRIYSAGTNAGVYKVRWSDDNIGWTDHLTGVGPFVKGWYFKPFAPATHRYWRLELTNTPGAGSWLNEGEFTNFASQFEGRIDDINWEQDPIALSCSDEGAWVLDTQIEAETQYGTGGGEAVQTSMQNILNGWPSGKGVPTLSTPVSPAWNIKTYTQDRVKVMEAIRNLALQIAWDLRFRYNATNQFLLTFMDPDRTRVTVDATIGPTHYHDVQKLHMTIAEVRNAGAVSFLKADGTVGTATHSVAGSITKHGRRFMQLPSAKNIDTQTEADKYVQGAVKDLADGGAEQEIDMLYFWPVQLFDRYTFTQNAVHYDADQTLAVVGYQHTLEGGSGHTTVQVAGKVIGAYDTWMHRGTDENASNKVNPSTIACPAITLAQKDLGPLAVVRIKRVTITFTKPASSHYDHMEFVVVSDTSGDVAAKDVEAVESPAAFTAMPGVTYTVTPTVVTKDGGRTVGTAVAIVVTNNFRIGRQIVFTDVAGVDDGYTLHSSASDGRTAGSTVKESQGKEIRRLIPKTLFGDADSFDGVPEGSTYNRPLATAITSGQIDMSKAGVIERYANRFTRSSGDATAVSTIVQHVANTGHAASTMQESGGKVINRLFAKTLAGDADHLDGVPEGTTYKRAHNTAIDGSGQVDLSKSGTVNKIMANIARSGGNATTLATVLGNVTDASHAGSSMQESGGKVINRLLAKAAAGDADSLDGCPDGSTWKRVTNVNSSNQVRASSARSNARVRCRMPAASTQSISSTTLSNGTWTALTWTGSDDYDTDALHDTGSNTSRISMVTGIEADSGVWIFVACVVVASVTDATPGIFQVSIRKNGSDTNPIGQTASTRPTSWADPTVILCVGVDAGISPGSDYYEVVVNQDSGAAVNVIDNGNETYSFFAATHIW